MEQQRDFFILINESFVIFTYSHDLWTFYKLRKNFRRGHHCSIRHKRLLLRGPRQKAVSFKRRIFIFIEKYLNVQRIYNVSLVNVKETKQKMSEESDNTQVVKDFVSNLTVNIWSIKFYGYG